MDPTHPDREAIIPKPMHTIILKITIIMDSDSDKDKDRDKGRGIEVMLLVEVREEGLGVAVGGLVGWSG